MKIYLPVFFYEPGKNNVDYRKKIKVERKKRKKSGGGNITKYNLEDAKREIGYEFIYFLIVLINSLSLFC